MSAVIVGIATGLISGVIASFMFWFIMTHFMVPKIEFSKKITKLPSKNTNSSFKYQFKFHNANRKNNVLDVSIHATVYFPDYPKKGTTTLYEIPVDTRKIMELEPKTNKFSRPARKITLMLEDKIFIKEFNKSQNPENLKLSCHERNMKLEDLFSLCSNSHIRVYVAAIDGFSGSRKVFKSHNYTKHSIVESQFIKGTLETEI
jgi:hypothetical protein